MTEVLYFLKHTPLFTHQSFPLFKHTSTVNEGIITEDVSV